MSHSQDPSSPPLKRFWLPALALALFLLTLLIGNFALPQSKRVTSSLVGHDFLAFYTAGTFIHQNRPHDLYDLQKVQAFQHDLARRENLEIGASFGPFWNPPFYAPIFAPLSALPYRTALLIWELLNLACLTGAIILLTRILRPAPPRITLLVPMLLVISMPLIQALTHGQNTLISLFLLTVVVTFWRSGRAILAGLTSGLLLYKPQLGALVALAVVLTLGRRALVGLAVTCLALFLTTLIALPGTISDYLARMPGNLHQFQVIQPYLWDRHVTLRAFWRLLLQGRAAGEITLLTQSCYVLSAAALAIPLAKVFWKRRHNPTPASLDCFIAAVIAATPLLMPFYFDYDLLLISVAAVLYANSRLHSPAAHGDPWLTRVWITLYLWLMVNSTVARFTHVNLSVFILGVLAALLSRRAAAVDTPVKSRQRPLQPMPESGTVSIECPEPQLNPV